MTDTPLFQSNAHGDIWQEPSLFDQGGPVHVTTSSVRPCECCGRPEIVGAGHVGPVYCAECLHAGHDRGDS